MSVVAYYIDVLCFDYFISVHIFDIFGKKNGVEEDVLVGFLDQLANVR